MDAQLKRGLLDACVLSAIKSEDSYGYKIIKDMQPRIINQQFDNLCSMTLSIRQSEADQLIGRLEKVEDVNIERK